MKKVLYFLGTILFSSCIFGQTPGSFQGTFVSTPPGENWQKFKIENFKIYFWEVNPSSGRWGEPREVCSLKSDGGKAKVSKGYSSFDGSLMYSVETNDCNFYYVFFYFPNKDDKYYYQFMMYPDLYPIEKVSENYNPWN